MPVVIKLKGMPWETSSSDIKQFFRGSKLAEHDIHLAPSEDGKACGVGFACFRDDEDARRAMQRNGAYLGKRYIELFLSSQAEMEKALRDGIPRSTLQDRSPKKDRSSNRGRSRSKERSKDRSRSPRDRSSLNRTQNMERNDLNLTYQNRGSFGKDSRGMRGRGSTRGGFRGRARGTARGKGVRGGIGSTQSFSASKKWHSEDNQASRGGRQSNPSQKSGRGGGFFDSSQSRTQQATKGLQPVGPSASSSLFLKLSGMPYTAQDTDILNFFKGINITAVHIIPNKSGPYAGRSSGCAFVECATQTDCVKALQKHGEYLGKRYLNVVRSTFEEIVTILDIDLNLLTSQFPGEFNSSNLNLQLSRNVGSNTFPSNPLPDTSSVENPAMSIVAASANINLDDIKDGCVVGMRNLPTVTTTEEILQVFRGFPAIPDSVRIHYLDVNRCSGDAMITLVNNEEARRAIRELSGKQLGNRKIELFLL